MNKALLNSKNELSKKQTIPKKNKNFRCVPRNLNRK